MKAPTVQHVVWFQNDCDQEHCLKVRGDFVDVFARDYEDSDYITSIPKAALAVLQEYL